MKLYIYDEESMEVVAIAEGDTNEECEGKAEGYIENGYAATYSPAFGSVDGLEENPDAEVL